MLRLLPLNVMVSRLEMIVFHAFYPVLVHIVILHDFLITVFKVLPAFHGFHHILMRGLLVFHHLVDLVEESSVGTAFDLVHAERSAGLDPVVNMLLKELADGKRNLACSSRSGSALVMRRLPHLLHLKHSVRRPSTYLGRDNFLPHSGVGQQQ